MSNLLQRIITALLGVAIMITAIVYDQLTFALVFAAIMIITLREFYGLVRNSGKSPFETWGLLISLLFFGFTYSMLSGYLPSRIFWALLPFLFISFVFPLFRQDKTQPIHGLAFTLFGIIYICVPFCLALMVAFRGGEYNYSIIIGLLLAQWASDTGAYVAGRTLGRTKLFEKVSPNKTWEGTIGGALLALGILYIWSGYFEELSTLEWLGLGIIMATFGSLGDLVESLFKRSLAIKDSGRSIPGHGGFLDRFDGLLLALPFATAYLMLIG